MVIFYAVQLVDALGHLHRNGILHRDLKLENVLVNPDGYLTLIDFGISKKLEPGDTTGTVAGTLEYFCPELVKGT